MNKVQEKEPEDADYILPEPEREVQRLTTNDSVFLHAMKGKRILAPLDLSKPGLRILDSATADGLFLRSIAPLLTQPYTLEGFDIMPSFFPASPPPNTTLAVHSITEPWPAEMHSRYDFVHQRLGLLGVGRTATIEQAVSYLGALVKPGGWIQLGELDVRAPASGGQAMVDAMALIRAVFTTVCSNHDFAHDMASILKAQGFEDIREEPYEVFLGPKCDDPVIGQRGIDMMQESWHALLGAAKRFEVDLPEHVTDRLIERLGEELKRDGGSYIMLYAYGRKPQ